jgi:hypothetical protein
LLPVQAVLMESMVPFDHELLLGLRRDARFGSSKAFITAMTPRETR